MSETAADVLIDTIHDWGVDVIFGLPGDGIDGIMEALRKRQDKVRFSTYVMKKRPHSWPALPS
jgi:pyruvate dehydrogenase (quinone)/pyruvate oxidase